MFRRVSTLFLQAQRFLCLLPYLAYAVHVCPQSSCGVGSLLFCLSSESVSVDEVPSDLTLPHTPPSVLAEAECCSARVLRVGVAFSKSCAASLSV